MTISHKIVSVVNRNSVIEKYNNIKNSLEGLDSRFDLAKERFSRLDQSSVKIMQTKK